MLKPKKTITKKEIERDPFLESINKTQAHLQEKRSYYMKMALALIVVLIGYNIISEKKSRLKKPDYYLVLPWHFKKTFIQREKNFLKRGGKLIFPLPNVKVISKKN